MQHVVYFYIWLSYMQVNYISVLFELLPLYTICQCVTCQSVVIQLTEAKWCMYASINEPALVQIMACQLAGAKPLSEPMLEYCWLDSWEQISS